MSEENSKKENEKPSEEEQILSILTAFEKMTSSFQTMIGKLAESMTSLTDKISLIEQKVETIEKIKEQLVQDNTKQSNPSESTEKKEES